MVGASIISMMLCWQITKLFSAMLGGSPALTGGDLVGTSAFLAGSAVAVGSMAYWSWLCDCWRPHIVCGGYYFGCD